MKKTLLAAALMAGFAGIAHADTSVTLYGIIDGGIGYQQLKGDDLKNKRTGLISGIQSGNRWGLKGSEDLGNGLRAVFQLESGFDLGTGKSGQGNRLFGRHATLGLAGDSWGQLDLGRQTNIASKYLDIASPFGSAFDQANVGAVLSAANTARYDNMVMYQTPNFSGFQAGIGYSFNVDGNQKFKPQGSKDPNKHALTTGLRYANGPIGAALTYDQFKDRAGIRADGTFGDVTAKAWGAAFSYDFEVVKLHLGGGQTRDGIFETQTYAGENPMKDEFGNYVGLKGLRINSYVVGVSAPVGAGKIMASWQMADLDKAPKFMGNVDTKKQQTYSLGYSHPLSKRTNVYAVGSYAKNVQFESGLKATLVGVGLRHQF